MINLVKFENTNTLPAAKQSLSDGDLARAETIMVSVILHTSRVLPLGLLDPYGFTFLYD